jgi:hypothetical protein
LRFAGAVIALLPRPVNDRLGAKSVMGLPVSLAGVRAVTITSTQERWTNDTCVLLMM